MATHVVIGATGDVGRGIVAALLDAGHGVIGLARDPGRLAAFAAELAGSAFRPLAVSLDDDASAVAGAAAVRAMASRVDGVVVSINGPRRLPGLLALSSDEFAELVGLDLVTHFTAARAFLPVIAPGGVLLGIGGGSADFVLARGAHLSVAQAGLRMLYRGLAQEVGEASAHVRLLTIASVVNGRTTASHARPEWVTAAEVGAQVAAIVAVPDDFPQPVWRISRREADGRPGFAADAPTRVQGLTT